MNADDTLATVKLLAKGHPVSVVAAAVGAKPAEVSEVGGANGMPDKELLRAAAKRLSAELQDTIPATELAPFPPASRPTARSAHPAPTTGPASGGTYNGAPTPRPALTVEELARACKRSEHKRTQALGVKLTELAERITTALRSEREAAEMKAKRSEELAAAQAEVKRLTKALAEAKAKATAAGAPGGVRGGARECPECGKQLANPQALGAHKRHTHGIAGKTTTPRSTA